MRRRAVLFDLDGTLVDTAPDMGSALNLLREEQGRPALAVTAIRPWVSKGAAGLVKLGFGDVTDQTRTEALRQRFLEIYAAGLCVASVPFAELKPVLARVEASGHLWGVVTNKPEWLARPLLEQLGLLGRSACLVCGDTLPRRKPHPDPLLHAATLIDVAPGHSVYVGDDRRDVTAGRAAGMKTIAAGWGYIPPDDPAEGWGADSISASPAHLDEWLTSTRWLDADPAHD